MSVLTRLNLRHNWLLIVAGIIGIGALSMFSDIPFKFSGVMPFDSHSTINYAELLSRYGDFPAIQFLIILLIAVIMFFVTLANANASKVAASIIALLSCVVLCGGFTSYVLSGDGSKLAHVQTLHQDKITYQLTRVRTIDSGLLWDTFWIFRCDSDENHCLYIEHNGRKFNPIIGDSTHEPSALLTLDTATNALYLQIGDQKTLIAQ